MTRGDLVVVGAGIGIGDDNLIVFTPEIDNTFKTCMCLFRSSGNNRYKTNLSGGTQCVINPCIRPCISLRTALWALSLG